MISRSLANNNYFKFKTSQYILHAHKRIYFEYQKHFTYRGGGKKITFENQNVSLIFYRTYF